MMRKLLAVIGGVTAAGVMLFIFTPLLIRFIPGLWSMAIGAVLSGITIGFIADDKLWIPGAIVGLITGAVILFFIAWMKGVDSNWHPGMEYANVIISTLLPVVFAEITGRSVAHLRSCTSKSQINL